MNLAGLRKRAAREPDVGARWLDLASALDARGRETEAIPVYLKALRLGVDRDSRHAALLALASSYRETGQLANALKTVERARREYPEDPAVDSFHALILLDSGRARQATRVLGLALLRETSPDAFGGFANALGRKFRGVTQKR